MPDNSTPSVPAPSASSRVIYTLGSGRSGSTILDFLLGAHSQIFAAGELQNYKTYFQKAATQERYCSCGELLRECPFWQRIRDRLAETYADPILDLKSPRDPRAFIEHNSAIVRAILDLTGATYMADSSKRVSRIWRFWRSPQFEIAIVHLIRDARAVAYSSLKTKERQGKTLKRPYSYKQLWKWQLKNLGIRLVMGWHPRYVFVRYEDFASNPERELRRILATVGLEFEPQQLQFWEQEQHQFAGNSATRSRGKQAIAVDREYVDQLPADKWWRITLLCLPGLLWFGYPPGRNR